MILRLTGLIIVGVIAAIWCIKAPIMSSYLTKKLGLEVSVRNISIFPTEIDMKYFKIENPSGFSSRTAFEVEKTKVKYRWSALTHSPSEIDLITLDNVALNIEIRKGGTSDNNWAEIGSYMPKRKSDRQVVVHKVIVRNLTVTTEGVGANTLGVAGIKHFDQIEFDEIDSREGFPTKELINQIFEGAGLKIFIQKFVNPTQQIQKALNPFHIFGTKEQKKAPETGLEGSF